MASTFTDSKSDLMRRAAEQLTALQSKDAADAPLTTRQKLALTCRALFDAGHDSGLAGQITARAERDGTYYTQRLGLGFDEITDANLLLVDEDLNVLEGDGIANPANRFHSWIYRARPDVQCIVHTHAFHVAALSMLEVPLIVSHMDTTPLYGDCAFLEKWPGVPVGNEEGRSSPPRWGTRRRSCWPTTATSSPAPASRRRARWASSSSAPRNCSWPRWPPAPSKSYLRSWPARPTTGHCRRSAAAPTSPTTPAGPWPGTRTR